MDVKTKPTNRLWISRIALLACLTGVLVGCSSEEKPAAEKKAGSENQTAQIQANPAFDPAQQLIGTWYGRAQLDRERLVAKSNGLTIQESQQLQQIAAIFQTTEIGAYFDAEGNMELDIQVKPNGQVLRDSTAGQWSVLKVEDNAVVIQTVESLPGGGIETNRVRYQFSAEGDRAFMVAPTSEWLADCHPMFVFERVQTAANGSGQGAVADRANESEVR